MDTASIVVISIAGVLALLSFSAMSFTLSWIPRLRLWSVVVYCCFAGFALTLYDEIHVVRDDLAALSRGRYVEIGIGIHGITVSSQYVPLEVFQRLMVPLQGILLSVWTMLAARLLREPTTYTYSYTREKRGLSTKHFYFFIGDLCFLACLITAISYSSLFLPSTLQLCSSEEYSESALFTCIGGSSDQSSTNACQNSMAVQTLGIVSACVLYRF
jgi:hypothetical protein